MSVDFPEPETPVTTVRHPRGTVRSTPFKLFAVQSWISIVFFGSIGRRVGASIRRRPARKSPVVEASTRMRSSAVPSATMRPP